MRNIKYAVCVLSLFLLFSCKKDSEALLLIPEVTSYVEAGADYAEIYCTVSGNATVSGVKVTYKCVGESENDKISVSMTKAESATFAKKYSVQINSLKTDTEYEYTFIFSAPYSSCEYDKTYKFKTKQASKPTVQTLDAVCEGTTATITTKLVSNGGASVQLYGVQYSEYADFSVFNTQIMSTAQTKCELSGLNYDTKYYVRAFAKNRVGEAYGEILTFLTTMQKSVQDVCGNTYSVVKIGEQYWMAENLRCTKYDTQSERAGQMLQTSDSYTYAPYYIDGRYITTYYSGNLTNEQRQHLGLLYNWAAAMGYTESEALNQTGDYSSRRQGICPNGWHLPSDEDWSSLNIASGDFAGSKLKSKRGWYNGGNGVDVYGFSGLPAGYGVGSSVYDVGGMGYFWTSDASESSRANGYVLYFDTWDLHQNGKNKYVTQSVRCLRN